jgi:tRNA threonylcarbamoyl adenosine modification protein YeaZ
MKVLGLDTTRKCANIFTFNTCNGDNVSLTKMNGEIKHSEGLFLYLEKVLFSNQASLKDYDYLACVVGPGSFTGIRVGMATIKGFNKAVKKTIVPINMFEVLLPEIKSGIIALNSTSTSVYYASVVNKKITETGVVEKSKLIDLLDGNTLLVLQDEQNDIGVEYNNYKVVNDLSQLYYKAIVSKIDSGSFDDFVPYYLQLSQAERNLKDE